MSDQPRSRQDLYDRIRTSSKQEVILAEMTRLGFWSADDTVPADPEDEARRTAALSAEMERLRQQLTTLHNEKKLRQALLKKRLAASKQRQVETKQRRERERLARAEAWQQKKTQGIVYLGEGVSFGLGQHDAQIERLQALGLPVLRTAADLAGVLHCSVGDLRFLGFSRRVARISHYVRFRIPKRSGGERLISAPMPRLKAVQHVIRQEILERVVTHEAAHGFCKRRSIVTNAQPHIGQAVVVNLDLKDFFPTVAMPRVRGLFHSLGYSQEVASLLGLLCTEPASTEVSLDGQRFFVSTGERFLPQGAPSSPAITNLLCRRLDRRLTKGAATLGFVYTRYADDLSFSAGPSAVHSVGKLLGMVADIVAHEGFVVHPDKTHVARRGSRQEVTGLVVNERPSLARGTLRRFRATLFQIEKDGLHGKRWGQSHDVLASIRGFANYVRMIDAKRGAVLMAQVERICARYGGKPSAASPPAPKPSSDVKKRWKLY